MQVREFDPKSLDKLLPCPFCGGDAELDTAQGYRAINGHFGNRVVVYCTKCDADMGTCVEDVPDIHPNEVIERWNRRADNVLLRAQAEEIGKLRGVLETIRDRHVPAQPMADDCDEADYIRKHHTELRKIARQALGSPDA